jgi:prepilin-type N-terminal cleavage/methylation domain-containing protein
MKRNAQKGFTLIEIAIVLVIVGLLLGAALKGQELIFNTKVKATYNLSRELSAAFYGYQDRYKAMPGDDIQASTRFPNGATINGNNDGFINANGGDCRNGATVVNGENCAALHHLRLSGFINGTVAQGVNTPFGGLAMVSGAGAIMGGAGTNPVMAHTGGGLTHKIMTTVESSFDDSNPRTGTVRCPNLVTYDLANVENQIPGWCMFWM